MRMSQIDAGKSRRAPVRHAFFKSRKTRGITTFGHL
jgi:hypothetical protein